MHTRVHAPFSMFPRVDENLHDTVECGYCGKYGHHEKECVQLGTDRLKKPRTGSD